MTEAEIMLQKAWRRSRRIACLTALGCTALTGCVDESDSEPGSVNTLTRQAAQTAGLAATVDTPIINEGELGSVTISTLCTNSNADLDVDIIIDWGDGSPNTTDTLTVGVEDVNGDVCPSAGQFVVCDSTSAVGSPCAAYTYAYPDNGPAADNNDWTIEITAENPPGSSQSTTQTKTIKVNNLAPLVTPSRTGAAFEGRVGTFTASVDDPGLRTDEIASIVYAWTPVDQTLGDTTVTIDCVANAAGSPICTSVGVATDTLERIYLDDGLYTFSVTVTDKDGASTTQTTQTTINNGAPTGLSFNVNNTIASVSPAARTALMEGTLYPLAGQASDPGIDQLAIDWNFGVAGQNISGTAEITKASYPNLIFPPGSTILTPSFRWDDDDDAVTKPYDIILAVSDDDGGSATTTRYIDIVDVDPNITSFSVDDSTISESEIATFSITSISGAQDETFDPIDRPATPGSSAGRPRRRPRQWPTCPARTSSSRAAPRATPRARSGSSTPTCPRLRSSSARPATTRTAPPLRPPSR